MQSTPDTAAESAADPAVHYQRRGAVGVLTLNRPENRNAMTTELLDAFGAALAAARDDAALRALVITGTGRCFSAGADLRASLQTGDGRLPHERSFAMYAPFLAVLDVEVPVIAALNGHAVGGGFGLSLLCDLRIGAIGARYGANFTRIGLSPGMAISATLPHVVGPHRATELLLTGRLFDAAEGLTNGYLLEACEPNEVLPRAVALAEVIAANAPIALRLTRKLLRTAAGFDPRQAALREAYAQAETIATADAEEGVAALLQKRAPRFAGR
ncbi:MAG: enoyl-CoA hydratase/isomerase family protein [Deltaproteobacteria bacterium]|nr:enoyl-CoA hydratase/isomerase family protein [Deltaproteobacteria bacterium]